jgi:hypothetical protein
MIFHLKSDEGSWKDMAISEINKVYMSACQGKEA